MTSSLTFSGWNWIWPVLAFGLVALGVLGWSYRAAAGAPLHQRCQSIIRKKYGGQGCDGDPMQLLKLAGKLQGILTRNRLQNRKAA